ncbi:hypothetical protein O181_004895, partial [Austropuccinia psidii MF-1]|nr:hypothetical protein [Austropuccinia psidii MF-1]
MEFYNKAAYAIDLLDKKQGSLKSIAFNLTKSKHHPNHAEAVKSRQISDGKRLLKVVIETLK